MQAEVVARQSFGAARMGRVLAQYIEQEARDDVFLIIEK